MPAQAPIGHHLSLYAYWEAKRRVRPMPARSDINPADIPFLLPFLVLIEKAGDQFRNRLVGSAVVRELGHDATGKPLGTSLPDQQSVAEARAIFERVFTTGRPVLTTGAFIFKSGVPYAMSMLVLPLSEDGKEVNMALSSLVARRQLHEPNKGFLKNLPVRVCDMIEVRSAADLERLCHQWEEQCRPIPAH